MQSRVTLAPSQAGAIAGLAMGLAALSPLLGCAPTGAPQGAPQGGASTFAITATTTLSSNAELLRRSLPDVARRRLSALAPTIGRALSAQAIDPSNEHFLLYRPGYRPARGYRLIVFVLPNDVALVPPGWAPVLDQYGILFVTAARSGNDTNVLARREPLALIAEQAVVRQFQVDPSHIWVAGFSGGSRVAMRLALAYPDIFTAAILNAGSDPIGDGGIPLPPADLAARFRAATRLVYVTGEWDSFHLDADTTSTASMQAQCVRNVQSVTMPHAGHTLIDGASLRKVIKLLLAPAGGGAIANCR